jgi:hypothetical protein|tara:strand:+ start:39 stop:470 length:432 start_codon:yes stop_codon:yes gene_type:complete
MTDKFSKLNETFNTDGNIVPKVEVSVEKAPEKIKPSSVDDAKKDYDYTRGNLYSLIEKGQEALNSVMELAQESDSPRAYEVVGQILKNVSDTTDKLIDLQKKMKDIDDSHATKAPSTVNNTMFVGSTAELAKMLKDGFKEDPK